MNILNFIVIEGRPDYVGEINNGDELFKYTMQGECYIPINTPVPVIVKGKGCIGIGLVSELRITETSSSVFYTISDISDTNAKAYYDLYRNQATASATGEYQEDVVIPGMMRGSTSIPRPSYNSYSSKKKKNEKHRSLMDYPDAFDNY